MTFSSSVQGSSLPQSLQMEYTPSLSLKGSQVIISCSVRITIFVMHLSRHCMSLLQLKGIFVGLKLKACHIGDSLQEDTSKPDMQMHDKADSGEVLQIKECYASQVKRYLLFQATSRTFITPESFWPACAHSMNVADDQL